MPTTENEARFKYCPLLMTHDDKMKFCQGAQCMMWRWDSSQTDAEATGHCGLAGSPWDPSPSREACPPVPKPFR